MTCLVVDDNLNSKTAIRSYINQIKDIANCFECSNAIEAYNIMQNDKVDIMFLEIDMPGVNGIDFVRNLGSTRPVINLYGRELEVCNRSS